MDSRDLFTLLDNAGDAAFAVEPQGRICYWSPKAEELLGFSQAQALSKNCEDVLVGEDDAGCAVCTSDCQILQSALKRGDVPAYDLHVATGWGGRKWLNVSIIVAHLKQGPSPLTVHLMRDVERRKKIESVTRDIMVRVGELTEREADDALWQTPSEQPRMDLTPREVSILRLLSLGRSTKDIATQLHISTTTVRNHIQHVLAKTQCHTRLEAVIRAARQRLI